MLRKLYSFFRLPMELKLLLLYTTLLAIYSFHIFKWFKSRARFGKIITSPVTIDSTEKDIQKIMQIRWAIHVINKFTFWENVCRHQALQAAMLCKYHKIPYLIYVGCLKDVAQITEGHVWTMSGSKIITGFCNPNDYFIFAVYAG